MSKKSKKEHVKKRCSTLLYKVVQSSKVANAREAYDFLFRELLEARKSQAKKKQFDKSKQSVRSKKKSGNEQLLKGKTA